MKDHSELGGMFDMTGVVCGEDGIKRSQAGVLFYEKHWAIYEGWFWETYGTTKPAFVRDREGVPLVTYYRRGTQ